MSSFYASPVEAEILLENQGLLAIAFFEATAFIVLLVLFFLLRHDHPSRYFRLWLIGWMCLTVSSLAELGFALRQTPELRLVAIGGQIAAVLVIFGSILQFTSSFRASKWPTLPVASVALIGAYYLERGRAPRFGAIGWQVGIIEAVVFLAAGWMLWRFSKHRGHGAKLLAGALFISGLQGIDRPDWPNYPIFLLRVAFDHLLGVAIGISMVVLVLEGGRTRTEELNDKMHRLTLLTAASTQTLNVGQVLDQVLRNLVDSLGASHGIARLIEGEGNSAQLIAKASVGFKQEYLKEHATVRITESWVQRALQKDCVFLRLEEEADENERQRMLQSGVNEVIVLALPGKDGPLGVISIGSARNVSFQRDEVAYLINVANLLGLTLRNLLLFEQVATVQKQWAYTFDSIGDPILVHDREFRILRSNQRMDHLLGRETGSLVGRGVLEVLPCKGVSYSNCPYCEGLAGEGDEPDPWLSGYFLASNSTFTDPMGHELGTVHVLKDISERKRAEEKYRDLVSNVQEGVFISTPQGRFLDFNEACVRMLGCASREEMLAVEIPMTYVNTFDRERLKRLLQEHGSVADYEFEIRRKDGEIRTMMESSIAVRDEKGNISAIQGFVLDITERKRAEQEIRRRNRELMVLNSIAQTLTESMDLTDSLNRTLRQIMELFSLDASSLYLYDTKASALRRIAAVGHRTELARNLPPMAVNPELLQQITSLHATFVSAQGLPLPPQFRESLRREGFASAFVVILWSKDRVIGGLVVATRTQREFSPADINLLIAVGSQISGAIDRSSLHEETRQAYENLRRTQEQLLHSEKMAAIGQLISGVAHELNNPLTAILGYSQLLTSSGQLGPQGVEYADKLYRQAQRTHRIVQNLLSSSRQHKPERVAVQLNQILEDTLALRDYDLRMSNIRVHLDLWPELPTTSADPHQLQQVFLNLVNNAVDAILERSADGDLWVSSGEQEGQLFVEFTDSGPGVQDASRVFNPFYTTKPVGKGTGLGLSICYGIITEHGGTIRVKNVPPRGASFRIELPLQPTSVSRDLNSAPPSREARILLVSQNDSILKELGAALVERGHSAFEARNDAEARSRLEAENFDVIVVDAEFGGIAESGSLQAWIAEKLPQMASHLIVMPTSEKSPVTTEGTNRGSQTPQKSFSVTEVLALVESTLEHVYAAVDP